MENPKQLILADSFLRDIMPVMDAEIDISIGSENNFEVKVNRQSWGIEYAFGNILYIPGTEYGGIIGGINTDTSMDTISLLGMTWRGYLDKKIIVPPSGQDYATATGELNEILATLISGQFGDYFSVSSENTGVNVDAYQFERYCTLLSGIEKMLKSVSYKLHIEYIQQEQGQPGYVEISAVPIVDYSSEIELSQDSKLNFSFINKRNGVNHLICLGKGELQDRQVIDLYVGQDGSIGTTQYYTGIEEIAETYENTSAESEELEENGIQKLRELTNSTSFSMDVETLGLDVEIGDIIGGRDYLTGLYAKKPIISKIYRVANGKITLEYEIEGDD